MTSPVLFVAMASLQNQNRTMKNRKYKTVYLTVISMAIAMLFSCEKPILSEDTEEQKTITFQLLTPSITRATAVADFKKVVVCDVKGGYIEQVITQSVTDADFGTPTIQLSGGQHTLTFLATDNADAIINGSVVEQNTVGDTFLKSIDINTATAPTSQRVVLERIVAQVLYQGEGTVTISGIRRRLDTSTGRPASGTATQQLAHGQSLFSFVPDDETLVMDDSRNIHIQQNNITVIYDNDGTHSDPDDPTTGEYMVMENDTAQIFAARMEITDITLEKTSNPQTAYAAQMYPYRMPTRREAYYLVKKELPDGFWTGARCLAYDRPEDKGFMGATGWGSGDYYTFTWAPNGSLNKAGTKTPYSIKPVRVIPLVPISTPFSLDADFTWSTDTTTVIKY